MRACDRCKLRALEGRRTQVQDSTRSSTWAGTVWYGRMISESVYGHTSHTLRVSDARGRVLVAISKAECMIVDSFVPDEFLQRT